MRMDEDTLFLTLGWVMLLTVALNLGVHWVFEGGDIAELFWYCNVAALLLAYGLFRKSAAVVTAVCVMSVPTQFFWILDWLLQLFGGGFGRTAWLFDGSNFFLTAPLSVLLHALIIPVAAWAMWRLGFSWHAHRYMFPVLLVLLPATYLFTDMRANRNCMFFPCDLNYVQHADIIMASTLYGTPLYAALTMLFWLCIVMASYVFFGWLMRSLKRSAS